MSIFWDTKADCVERGDKLRDISPMQNKTYEDEEGFTHFVFSRVMFKNPKYIIPGEDFKLFKKFIDGGSREYPSDGNIPSDLVAAEARHILYEIEKVSHDKDSIYFKDAVEVMSCGKFGLVRGAIKLYLGKYTTRDWRRKRFTDDIDFWIYKLELWEYALKKNGWLRNNITKEWEKTVFWDNPFTNKREEHILIASNDINQVLDFGNCSFLEGSSLKNIFQKKVKRGHDVDLSDIINVAMVLNKAEGFTIDEWYESWVAFEESANTRNSRTISNMISLARYSYAIADYLERVGFILKRLHDLIYDKTMYPDEKINKIVMVSIHWQKYVERHGLDFTRELIHNYIYEQGFFKLYYSKNLRNFAERILRIVNEKVTHLKIIFEIEDQDVFLSFIR